MEQIKWVIELEDGQFLSKALIVCNGLWGTEHLEDVLFFDSKNKARNFLKEIKMLDLSLSYPYMKIKKIGNKQ